MVSGPYGILEPVGPQVPLSSVDLVVVPALAYDRRGHRLGYGGGFYDRCLRALGEARGGEFVAVGLGHGWQLVDELPAEAHDIPLQVIVTPTGIAHSAAR